jgi:hypothetical protein
VRTVPETIAVAWSSLRGDASRLYRPDRVRGWGVMRNSFRHYFRPTDTDFEKLWASALFAFDASVLLNIYGYSNDTREALVEFVNNNANRLALPHQFGLEFARRRCSAIIKQVNNYQKMEGKLNDIREHFLDPKREHPHLTGEFRDKYDEILGELARRRKEMEGLITQDPYLEKLLRAFEGKVGAAPTKNELESLHNEARERYARGIPPGIADEKKKGVPAAYGDYIAWRQLMNISKISGKDIILIIDDTKDDWWHYEHERMIGPRPEILEEFTRELLADHELYYAKNSGQSPKELWKLI